MNVPTFHDGRFDGFWIAALGSSLSALFQQNQIVVGHLNETFA